ncbi:lipopolysaccharide biosynthesis protein [Plebeiibacterium sediminum]|uniref:Lipopolysaccharide biosynthesis protein n=1 Tax=Plebeiibacterium sediminum TaxID=2992112 RepID=A0AAE3SEU6_9BACT|nr:lipopolysaccharide biosynthesis protein [Plebeiobacterium sediminum]MCW3786765.1 lipopolysaccharide biosynthesis protein [Plebeiobacterium sediminum]
MTKQAFLWSSIGKFGQQFLTISINILTARLLLPEDYGVVGVLAVFVVVSTVFVEGGFKDALIRDNKLSNAAYSSVFFLNVSIAVVLYFILFISAPSIADFFNNRDLVVYSRVLFLVFIFNALSVVHTAKLIKALDFKKIAAINIVSSVISGVIGLVGAYFGFGVWSLITSQVLRPLLRSYMMIVKTSWVPKAIFSIEEIKPLFRFGINLLLSGILGHVCANILKVIIGKFYTFKDVGYYDRASNMQGLAMTSLSEVINEVSYPLLANSGDNKIEVFKRITRVTIFLCVPIFLFLIIVADDLIIFLLTDKWSEVIPLFKLLCIIGMVYPLAVLNNNIIKVRGMSRVVLINELIRNLLLLSLVVIFRHKSVYILVLITVVINVVATFLYMISVEYKVFKGCIKFEGLNILLSLFASVFPLLFVYGISILTLPLFFKLSLQGVAMFGLYLGIIVLFLKSLKSDFKALLK